MLLAARSRAHDDRDRRAAAGVRPGTAGQGQGLVALTEREAGQIEFEFDPEHMPEFGDGADPEYFELWLPDGSLLQRSPSFDRSDQTRAASLVRRPRPATDAAFQDVRLPDGRHGRQVQIDFVPSLDPEESRPRRRTPTVPQPRPDLRRDSPTVTLLVAREREQLDAGVRRMELTFLGLGAVLVVALAGLMQLALRVGLRALERLTGEVRALDVTSLDTADRREERRPRRSRSSSSRSTLCWPGWRRASSGSGDCRATSPTSSRRRSPSCET